MGPHDVIERCRAGFWGCVTTLTDIRHNPGCLTLHWGHGPKLTFTDQEEEDMTTTSRQADTRLAPSDGDDNYLHIVSFTQWVLDKVLRIKVPRALCGVLLVADLDKPDPLESGAPTCPRCKALNR